MLVLLPCGFVGNAPAQDIQAAKHLQQRVVQRENLRPIAYADPGSRIRVGLRQSSLDSDVIIRRSTPATPPPPALEPGIMNSEAVLVQDIHSENALYGKNVEQARPIASITKLMTALVVVEAGQSMEEMLQISDADVDRRRFSRSRLPVGTQLSRAELLHMALMSSENRAANALGRYYPGGMPAFVRAMNDKARALGMRNTRFVEPTGLSENNVSTPQDLVKLVVATSKHPRIHRYTTDDTEAFTLNGKRRLVYNNTNRLIRRADWDITISKTGFINEAGQCLVMLARIDDREVAIVLLNAAGSASRLADALRIRKLVENNNLAML